MAIIKDVTVKINNGTATLDTPVQFYEKDHDVELRFKLMDYKYKYDKDPQNILNSVDEDILEAYTTIVNPRGHELEQINGVVKNDTVIFRLDPTYTDELDEVGTYNLQIHIKCTCSEFTIPPITFEVLERLKGIKVVTDGEDEVDNSEILDNSSKFVSDETGKLIIEWKKGDMISSAKLNAMVDVINDAVDEEAIRQANEIERQEKVNNKIQELEDTRVEYINKIDTELDSFADQVDASMTDYETRFNALTSKQQEDAEVIDARDGEVSLKARLDRDIEKAKEIYVDVKGSHISTDSSVGYAKDIEIFGNTIQDASDLADIRSVGDKVEGQELYEIPVVSCGKNLLYCGLEIGSIASDGMLESHTARMRTKEYIQIKNTSNYVLSGHNCATYWVFYDINYTFISRVSRTPYYITNDLIPNNAHFLKLVFMDKTDTSIKAQLEEGTQSTPYEPYQEDKLTILSPVQLEKVGDVRDRIICKDGVWGVEKNVSNIYPTFVYDTTHLGFKLYYCTLKDIIDTSVGSKIYYLSNKNVVTFNDRFKNLEEGNTYVAPSKWVYVATQMEQSDFENTYNGKVLVKYPTTQPTFIPLSNDQQIKLRTFAGQTNIHFETEIEGTIKAQVPKSLGATVNTHTEQINNLNKELDRVKKLEESTVSTVTTESDFTTVEATSNGYFEDVKLEGRTLVNRLISRGIIDTGSVIVNANHNKTLPGTFTVILNDMSKQYHLDIASISSGKWIKTVSSDNINKGILVTLNEDEYIGSIFGRYNEGWTSSDSDNFKRVLILEGDHTQNPPEYFEGLMSVGQDVEEVSVMSNTNMLVAGLEYVDLGTSHSYRCNNPLKSLTTAIITNTSNNIIQLGLFNRTTEQHYMDIDVQPNTTIGLNSCLVDNYIKWISFTKSYWENKSDTTQYYKHLVINGNVDKKPLLYYNPTTETWEKPILRQWDSIEKHSDGKYYYHKRSEEVVLNGSGDHIYNNYGTNFNGSCISFRVKLKNITPKNYALCISDYRFILNPLPTQINSVFNDEYIHFMNNGNLYLTIQKDKLTSLDSSGVSALFTKNPIKLVFELDREEVYECTNIDLITYENETNFIVNTGAIVPLSTLKVMCNINNVVRELQQKVSNLENYIQHVMIDALNNALDE